MLIYSSVDRYFSVFVTTHERHTSGPGRKAKVEGSLIRLFKAKEGSRKHEALACLNILGSQT
jgi:hypothetical protein